LECSYNLSILFIYSEPGYYEDGKFGVRIENLILVVKADTKVGCRVLTKLVKSAVRTDIIGNSFYAVISVQYKQTFEILLNF